MAEGALVRFEYWTGSVSSPSTKPVNALIPEVPEAIVYGLLAQAGGGASAIDFEEDVAAGGFPDVTLRVRLRSAR
jgi:hypothetical protein